MALPQYNKGSSILKWVNGPFIYKLNNKYNINNIDFSQGKQFCFATIVRGRSDAIYKMAKNKNIVNKLN